MSLTHDTSEQTEKCLEERPPTKEIVMEEGFITITNKRTRDWSPRKKQTVSPLRKHPQPNGQLDTDQVSQLQRLKIKVVKSEGWTSAFEIALALFKAYPHLEINQKLNKVGHTILSTKIEKTRDYIVSIKTLNSRPMTFQPVEIGPPKTRYAIIQEYH